MGSTNLVDEIETGKAGQNSMRSGIGIANEKDDVIMTPSEAAQYLRISVATLLRRARPGEIPGFRVGKLWRFRKSELDAWLQSKVSFFRHPCRERRETNDEFAATVPERVPDKEETHPPR